MKNPHSLLSHNIRILRREKSLSQTELAEAIKVKRSNIAAYESKNVEPRLRTILDIAVFFNISVHYLLTNRLVPGDSYPYFMDTDFNNEAAQSIKLKHNNDDVIQFIEKSNRLRRMLEGFKSFYSFKMRNMKDLNPDKQKLIFDIDNFIQLMEHLLTYNESVISTIVEE